MDAAVLAALEAAELPAGATVLRQGDLSDELLFIASGRASVTVRFDASGPMRVRSFGAGAMVGEVGFCLGLPRTATVVAEEPCRVMRLTRKAMDGLEARHPAAALALQRAVLRRVGRRLVEKHQMISALLLHHRAGTGSTIP